jgi:DeoR family transcriptional regulator, aga operon transcriptional repressor
MPAMNHENSSLIYPEERRSEILNRIREFGRVSVVDLSQSFGVSQVTIRADLALLAREAWVIRTHGGAVFISLVPELSLSLRRQKNKDEKERIGVTAAGMISNGEAVCLDTSSTALAIARHLRKHRELTVVTNSLAVAQALLEAPGVNVVMPGGTFQKDTLSLVGKEGLSLLDRFNLQKGFFGAHGIALREGLTDVSSSVAEIKAALLARCHLVYAIVDHTKWGRVGLASFASLEDLDGIITDHQVPGDQVELFRSMGIQVVLT